MKTSTGMTYLSAGVNTEQAQGGLGQLQHWVEKTFDLRKGCGAVRLPLGFFANVIDVGKNIGIAFATDGVGTKILVAQQLGKLDTVGIDCVAMNVNDVICVGAEPLAMVDYIAVETADPAILGELAKGLYEGARIANISIPGGEVAQVREMIRGEREGMAFDLVGTCIGTVPIDRIIVGRNIADGDVIVGLRSNGIHSNGLTLARRVFFDQLQWQPSDEVDELACSIGEELLRPTRIYVREVLAMLEAGLDIKALVHITSDGFLNLTRVQSEASFHLNALPNPHPIFSLIQSEGPVPTEEMFRVYNMGIGFCVVVAPKDVDTVQSIAQDQGVESYPIGIAKNDGKKEVHIPQYDLVGSEGRFYKQ